VLEPDLDLGGIAGSELQGMIVCPLRLLLFAAVAIVLFLFFFFL
jgi:hypothetical protein